MVCFGSKDFVKIFFNLTAGAKMERENQVSSFIASKLPTLSISPLYKNGNTFHCKFSTQSRHMDFFLLMSIVEMVFENFLQINQGIKTSLSIVKVKKGDKNFEEFEIIKALSVSNKIRKKKTKRKIFTTVAFADTLVFSFRSSLVVSKNIPIDQSFQIYCPKGLCYGNLNLNTQTELNEINQTYNSELYSFANVLITNADFGCESFVELFQLIIFDGSQGMFN